jgi:hypothetical protein
MVGGWVAGVGILPILAGWLVLVSYRHRHSVVGVLVGIFWYCTFWREPIFDDLAGTLFLKNLAGSPCGWYFDCYF